MNNNNNNSFNGYMNNNNNNNNSFNDSSFQTSEVDQLINCVQEQVRLESNEEDTYKFMKDDWESRLNKLKEYRPYVPPSQLTPNNKINKVPKKNNEINTNKKSNNNNDDDDLPPPPKPIDRKFFYGEEKKEEKDETINWCCICNDDGVIRCIDCENDAFCKRCFKETHPKNDYEMRNHRTKKIR